MYAAPQKSAQVWVGPDTRTVAVSEIVRSLSDRALLFYSSTSTTLHPHFTYPVAAAHVLVARHLKISGRAGQYHDLVLVARPAPVAHHRITRPGFTVFRGEAAVVVHALVLAVFYGPSAPAARRVLGGEVGGAGKAEEEEEREEDEKTTHQYQFR